MKRLLVTGASGFLGWHIIQNAGNQWEIFGIYLNHRVDIPGMTLLRTDITDYPELKKTFLTIMPDAVIHAAAVSDPNACEQAPGQSRKVNTEASIHLAGLCADLDIPCVFISSDLVFDGNNAPYCEDDAPAPVNRYGEQKVLAEFGMRRVFPKAVVCRLPLMFGDPGPMATNFLPHLVRNLKTGNRLKLFIDEFRTPLSGRSAAKGLMLALGNSPPIVHIGGEERISRYDFGCLVADMLGVPRDNITPSRQKDMDMPANRPPDVSLDSRRINAMGFCSGSIRGELEHLIIRSGRENGRSRA